VPLTRVGVVGAGLIGSSIGLALRHRGVDVVLRERDPDQLRLALALHAGRPWDGDRVDHAVVAVPPDAVVGELLALQRSGLAATASDVTSVKAGPVEAAAAAGCDMATFCGGHPVAGRERGGAIAARADLFAGRPWVLTPTDVTGAEAVTAATTLAELCGALPVQISPDRHDTAMAVLSHLPQLISSLLAAEAGELPEAELALVGQGFRDVTRLAGSDPRLWAQILTANRREVASAAARLAQRLALVVADLADADDPAPPLSGVIAAGNAGQARLPDKAGLVPHVWARVGVVVRDRPGELARLFTAVADWDINIEDVAVEHSRNAPFGRLELAVAAERGDDLLRHLESAGWTAYRRT